MPRDSRHMSDLSVTQAAPPLLLLQFRVLGKPLLAAATCVTMSLCNRKGRQKSGSCVAAVAVNRVVLEPR